MIRIILYFLLLVFIASCGNKKEAESDDQETTVVTPVTVTGADIVPMAEYIELNATSTFLQKSVVKASANGYLKTVNAIVGHTVPAGAELFVLKTKEAQSIGNTINALDSTFKFSGLINIRAAVTGHISEVNHQTGDYVQDGEALATISDRSSFVFVMQVPYELRQYVKQGENIELTLPGGQTVSSHVASFMPSVDTVSQTQGVVLKLNSGQQIPENLVAKARIIKSQKTNSISLPKSAILSNETQTEFWVMKLINPTTAVKVPVKKGIETGNKVEILSPKFSNQDKIVVTGNYGLADTAKGKIVQ